MKYKDRERIVERLPYESRIGYVAFCVQRCLTEARLHPEAAQQLGRVPLLLEGLDMLWSRAEGGGAPDPERLEAVRAHLDGYQTPDADGENVTFNYDVTLVKAASELRGGLLLLEDPDALDAYEVAAALEGPENAVSMIYVDWEDAGEAEVNVIDTALKRLEKRANEPFSREVFAGIPEWKRGKVNTEYVEGRLTGTDVNRED